MFQRVMRARTQFFDSSPVGKLSRPNNHYNWLSSCDIYKMWLNAFTMSFGILPLFSPPKGEVLNRFSRDMGFVDLSLPRFFRLLLKVGTSSRHLASSEAVPAAGELVRLPCSQSLTCIPVCSQDRWWHHDNLHHSALAIHSLGSIMCRGLWHLLLLCQDCPEPQTHGGGRWVDQCCNGLGCRPVSPKKIPNRVYSSFKTNVVTGYSSEKPYLLPLIWDVIRAA